MDSTDRRILAALQSDARVPNAQIAKQIGMVPSGTHERIRKLEESGVIQGYHARLNAKTIGLSLLAFVFVRSAERIGTTSTSKRLAEIPEVQEVHHVAGEDCYLVKVRVADTDALGRLLREQFAKIESILSTRTTIVLETVKESVELPLPNSDAGVSATDGAA